MPYIKYSENPKPKIKLNIKQINNNEYSSQWDEQQAAATTGFFHNLLCIITTGEKDTSFDRMT